MSPYFQTSDFPLAITLTSFGFRLDCLDRTSPNRVEFCFIREERLDEVVQDFWQGKLQIEPRSFYANFKLLKNRLLSEK